MNRTSAHQGKGRPSSRKIARWGFDAHHRFLAALLSSFGMFFLIHNWIALPSAIVATWDTFALIILGIAWFSISTTDPYESRRVARLQDSSRTVLFVIVISAAVASLFAVGLLLGGSAKDLSHASLAGHIGLSLAALGLSWCLIHTLFALRYAHFYYYDAPTVERDKVKGGLLFPGEENPTYLDFAYFSFVIGMTCQVSDVQISSSSLRRLALVHGLISFIFNTAILAAFVNIVAGLI